MTGTNGKGAEAEAVLFSAVFSSAKGRERRQEREVLDVVFEQEVREMRRS
jgi:hypothetical protein